jgi:antirestriction protein ArdC
MTTVYEIVTEKILKLLEQGITPWRREWNFKDGLPRNLDSKHHYKGYNLLYLAIAQMLEGWQYPLYLTYIGARKHGWHVRKGEEGNLVLFMKTQERIEKDPATGEERTKRQSVLRYYHVFNLDQIEGWNKEDLGLHEAIKIPTCEELIASFVPSLPEIRHGRPSYSPARDVIFMPDPTEFENEPLYYATLFHETVHATGAKHRLARPGIVEDNHFGDDQYSFEELIAEIGAAFLSARSGISAQVIEHNAAYVKAWREKLEENVTWIVKASSQAQKAVEYLLEEAKPDA